MKEMRARREAEKLVESKFREEVRQQKANMKVWRLRARSKPIKRSSVMYNIVMSLSHIGSMNFKNDLIQL